jgi:ABC-type transport system involved in Fe-S cluster assembly fused permease/ATPase subunit
MEMKVDKNGPVLIENNGRILGGHSFLFEKVVSGYSFTECLVESLLDKEFVKKFKNDKVDLYGYSFVLSSFSTFKLHACHVLDVVSKMPGFLNFATPLKIGDIVNPTTNLHNAIGFLCFVSKSYDEMMKNIQTIKDIEENDFKRFWS